MAELTPMMQQYVKLKEANPGALLFFRLGDFYEMFGEDAKTASRELDLTLTTRDRGKDKADQTPMCGVPYHSCEGYIARLIAKGYKVAICEQMEDPATAKGLVERDIIRVVTPGTVTDSSMLEDGRSNYISAVFLSDNGTGVCFVDVSTGRTMATAFSGAESVGHLINELGRFSPAEVVLGGAAADHPALNEFLRDRLHCHRERGKDAAFDLAAAERTVRRQFGEEALKALPQSIPAVTMALGGLLSYLYETQKTDLSYINDLDYYEQGEFMELDVAARRNLELTETLRSKEKRGSLLWVLDKTKTPMGSRCLRGFLERPLLSPTAIGKRQRAVAALVEDTMAREELILTLTGIGDIERLIGRIVYGTAGGRDMASLRSAIEKLPAVAAQLSHFSSGRLGELARNLDTLSDLGARIAQTLVDEPPFSVREGGFIRPGFHAEVDRLRDILSGGKGTIAGIEASEKEKTGIRTLKIKYNRVFGYYIEVSNSFKDQVPEHYIRKQTLANAERYVTQELKDLEHTILTASDRVSALEYELFSALRQEIADAAGRIQKTAAEVAELDAYASLAAVAVRNGYACPTVDESGVIEIHDGRHPVVEKVLRDSLFVPNDTFMGEKEDRTAIITGPNMAGKSTYMRQVALIVLLAQIGSFVPAKSARIGIVDRIFTRIGASDDLSSGQSTFMVEMNEVASILRQATSRSLLILDEIGRGTSTFDGMSIARAVLEYCADKKKLGAKTLFATHYHELTEMEQALPGVKNYNIAVKAHGDEISFLRKIIPGGADRSYGIEVAKLAGLPDGVIRRAREILSELEQDSGAPKPTSTAPGSGQISLTALGEGEVLDTLRRTQVDMLTPLEAMNLLYEFKKKLQ
ncbi:DNA mismatch repair protein MutS [bacterium 210917-DFI.7.65]|nr:DNA mismatch repair protein MutS [bacterium 210917-DFI.7.65]